MVQIALAMGYNLEEQQQLKKCFSEINQKITFGGSNLTPKELSAKYCNEFAWIIAHPRMLDSLSFVGFLRENIACPVILLSIDKLHIIAPQSLFVRCKRLELILDGKSTPNLTEAISIIRFADLEICVEHRSVMICGQKLNLTPKEFDLLLLLASNPKRVFTYEMIMDIIWREDCTFYSKKSIHNHVSNIKKKMNTVASEQNYIISIHGVGYKFDITPNDE